jgi:hypothetical protein
VPDVDAGWGLRSALGKSSPILESRDQHEGFGMRGFVFGSAAMAILLCPLPRGAVAAGAIVKLAENAPGTGQGGIAPNPPPAADGSRRQPIRAMNQESADRAEARLDCLSGRVDGRLGNQTRQAIKKFWATSSRTATSMSPISVRKERAATIAAGRRGRSLPSAPAQVEISSFPSSLRPSGQPCRHRDALGPSRRRALIGQPVYPVANSSRATLGMACL